jgi:hypothetical protein
MISAERLAYLSDNFDKSVDFCGGRIVFNSDKGSGSAPNNANVRYMGFAALMQPWKFRELVQHLPEKDRRGDSLSFLPSTASTKGWGPPTIYFDVEKMQVTGHEGRHRSILFEQACHEPMLVHFFPRFERARHMTYEVVTKVRQNLKGEKGSIDEVIGLNTRPRHTYGLFDYAFVDNDILTWK